MGLSDLEFRYLDRGYIPWELALNRVTRWEPKVSGLLHCSLVMAHFAFLAHFLIQSLGRSSYLARNVVKHDFYSITSSFLLVFQTSRPASHLSPVYLL